MSDGGKAKESGRGQLQEEVPSTGRRVTRRGFLRQAITGGVAAAGGFIAGRATSSEPEDTQRNSADYVFSEHKNNLAESLSAEDIAWVQRVIADNFELPFQELHSFDTNTKLHDHPKGVVSSIDERMGKKSGLRAVTWDIRGDGGKNSLSKHVSMHCWAELGSDGSIARLGLVVDLQKTFGTGLTPGIDQYIDTSHGVRIAAKDLEAVYQQVFKVPENLKWKDTATYASPSSAYHRANYVSKDKVSRVALKDSRTTGIEFGKTGNFPKDELIEDVPRYSYSYNVSNDGKAMLTITSAPQILSKA